jgi:serine/threonine protein kinase/CheY-like chemotaxis protein
MADVLRILLVDDDEVDRLMVRRTLERSGARFELKEAVDVTGGREVLRAGRFDCALLDYDLPDGVGLDILDDALAARVPVIMLTGLDDEAFGVQAVQRGAQDYMIKTEATSRSLSRAIRHAIERHRRGTSERPRPESASRDPSLGQSAAEPGRSAATDLPWPNWSQRLIGRRWGVFSIKRLLGKGAMGSVFLAENTLLRRVVALKIPMLTAMEDPQERALFLREARSTACLDHPSIIRVYSVGEVEGHPFLEMEYVPGPNLDKRIRDDNLSVEEALRIFLAICKGVRHAHEQGVIHRDLKPENVMCGHDGRVLVMDFGLARPVGATESLHPANTVVGTAGYIAPEQLAGDACDVQSDIYSLGTMLFRMLTGTMPFAGASAIELLTQQALQEPPPLRLVRPDLPEWLERVVAKMQVRDKRFRYKAVAEVIDHVERQCTPR